MSSHGAGAVSFVVVVGTLFGGEGKTPDGTVEDGCGVHGGGGVGGVLFRRLYYDLSSICDARARVTGDGGELRSGVRDGPNFLEMDPAIWRFWILRF